MTQTSVRLGEGSPIVLNPSPFVRQQLSDLREAFGPSQSQIIRAALAALYDSLGSGNAASEDEQLGELQLLGLRKAQVIEYALFWLWMKNRKV